MAGSRSAYRRRSAGDERPARLSSAHGSGFQRKPEGPCPADDAARFRTWPGDRFAAAGSGRRRYRPGDRRPRTRTTRRGCRRLAEEAIETVAEGPLAVGHAAIENAVQARADLARRLPHAERGQRRALCRQGQKRPQAAVLLCAGQRAAAGAHPAHDRGDRGGRDHLDLDRNRGAVARGQSDQAAAAALQRATARRQVVSLYPDHRRPLGAADPEAPRRADAARDDISDRSPPPAPSTAPSRRCSAPSWCAPAPTVSSKAAPGPACSTRSAAAPGPCTGEIDFPGYTELVREAKRFPVRPQPRR